MSLAFRDPLFQDKIRLGLSIAEVTVAVMLILLVNGFLSGPYRQVNDIAGRVLWLEDGQFKEKATMATDPVCGHGCLLLLLPGLPERVFTRGTLAIPECFSFLFHG